VELPPAKCAAYISRELSGMLTGALLLLMLAAAARG
jgi:hypothetical protein